MLLIDTDVLIWFTRGHEGAATQLSQLLPWQISTVTYIELAQGCRNKNELEWLKKGLAQRSTQVLPLTPAISTCAAQLIETHALSGGLQLADALIAATALQHRLTLLSGNVKHFKDLAGLALQRFDPDSRDAE